MIKYNKVQIDGDKLIVDMELEDKAYYEDLSILGLRIDIPKTYGTDTPYLEENEEDATRFKKEFFIPDIKNTLIIITPIVTEEFLPPDIPCGADIPNKAVIYNSRVLLDKGMRYLKTLGDMCDISRDFIDFILKKSALDMAIDTCNYNIAVKYWNMLTTTRGDTLKGCGCNGK